jgi:hypothetical protein
MGGNLALLVPLCRPCHEAIEVAPLGKKRILWGANKELFRRAMAGTESSRQWALATQKVLKERTCADHTSRGKKKSNKTAKPQSRAGKGSQACPAKPVSAAEKVRQDWYLMRREEWAKKKREMKAAAIEAAKERKRKIQEAARQRQIAREMAQGIRDETGKRRKKHVANNHEEAYVKPRFNRRIKRVPATGQDSGSS